MTLGWGTDQDDESYDCNYTSRQRCPKMYACRCAACGLKPVTAELLQPSQGRNAAYCRYAQHNIQDCKTQVETCRIETAVCRFKAYNRMGNNSETVCSTGYVLQRSKHAACDLTPEPWYLQQRLTFEARALACPFCR